MATIEEMQAELDGLNLIKPKKLSGMDVVLKPEKIKQYQEDLKAFNEQQKRKGTLGTNLEAAKNVAADTQGGEEFAQKIVGDGLTRISDNEDIQMIRDRLRNNLDSNSTENNLRKSQAIAGLQGQTQASQRQLMSSLATSGVRGGSAAAAQLELQAGAMTARSRLEENLMLNDIQRERAALNDFTQFTSSTAQFDIGQEQREKALQLEAQLGYTNLLATERNSIRQQQAANLLAQQQKQSGGKK